VKPSYKKRRRVRDCVDKKRVIFWQMDRSPTWFQDPRTSNPLNKAADIVALSA